MASAQELQRGREQMVARRRLQAGAEAWERHARHESLDRMQKGAERWQLPRIPSAVRNPVAKPKPTRNPNLDPNHDPRPAWP